MQGFGAFMEGVAAPWRGARWIAGRPAVWPLAAAPALLVAGSLALAFVLALSVAPSWYAATWPQPEGPAAGLWLAVLLVFQGAVFVASAVWGALLAGVLSRPFHRRLAAQAEAAALGVAPAALDVGALLIDAAVSAGHALLAGFAWVVAMGGVALVALFPAIGELLAPLLSAAATALFLGRELLDPPLTARRMPLLDRLRFCRTHLPVVLGLGGATTLALLVPGLGCLVLPAATAGATLWFCALVPEGGPS